MTRGVDDRTTRRNDGGLLLHAARGSLASHQVAARSPEMTTYLVRHACAGHKEVWTGDDRYRPLDDADFQQAAMLADFFRGRDVTRLISNTADQCIRAQGRRGTSVLVGLVSK